MEEEPETAQKTLHWVREHKPIPAEFQMKIEMRWKIAFDARKYVQSGRTEPIPADAEVISFDKLASVHVASVIEDLRRAFGATEKKKRSIVIPGYLLFSLGRDELLQFIRDYADAVRVIFRRSQKAVSDWTKVIEGFSRIKTLHINLNRDGSEQCHLGGGVGQFIQKINQFSSLCTLAFFDKNSECVKFGLENLSIGLTGSTVLDLAYYTDHKFCRPHVFVTTPSCIAVCQFMHVLSSCLIRSLLLFSTCRPIVRGFLKFLHIQPALRRVVIIGRSHWQSHTYANPPIERDEILNLSRSPSLEYVTVYGYEIYDREPYVVEPTQSHFSAAQHTNGVVFKFFDTATTFRERFHVPYNAPYALIDAAMSDGAPHAKKIEFDGADAPRIKHVIERLASNSYEVTNAGRKRTFDEVEIARPANLREVIDALVSSECPAKRIIIRGQGVDRDF